LKYELLKVSIPSYEEVIKAVQLFRQLSLVADEATLALTKRAGICSPGRCDKGYMTYGLDLLQRGWQQPIINVRHDC
jgi:hypothetical protein